METGCERPCVHQSFSIIIDTWPIDFHLFSHSLFTLHHWIILKYYPTLYYFTYGYFNKNLLKIGTFKT